MDVGFACCEVLNRRRNQRGICKKAEQLIHASCLQPGYIFAAGGQLGIWVWGGLSSAQAMILSMSC